MPLYSKSVKFSVKKGKPKREISSQKTSVCSKRVRGGSPLLEKVVRAAWRVRGEKFSTRRDNKTFTSDARSALPMVVAPKCMFDYL